jgi:hypothetical protein
MKMTAPVKPVAYYEAAYQKLLEIDHGQSSKIIAPQIGVSHNTVAKWRRVGFNPNMFPQIDPDTLEFAKKSLEAGMSYNQVAQVAGVSNRMLRKHFPGMGHPHNTKPDDETLEIARQMLEVNHNYTEVGRIVGLARGTLSKYFPGMGANSGKAE